jgi:Zn-finger nucleic acid-binding protein
MKCPMCKTPELLMTDRQGIEIDYCPTCRGVWLDRGELDKLIERAPEEGRVQSAAPQPAAILTNASTERRRDERIRYDDRDRRDDEYRERRHPYKKKKSMLGELFDFG